MQMFTAVLKELVGDQPSPPSPYVPWRFGNPLQLLQDLRTANFSHAQCTAYSHPMTFTLPDLVTFQLGPHGQSRPTLDRLKAAGRDNIDQEAQQVQSPALCAVFCLRVACLMPVFCLRVFCLRVACLRVACLRVFCLMSVFCLRVFCLRVACLRVSCLRVACLMPVFCLRVFCLTVLCLRVFRLRVACLMPVFSCAVSCLRVSRLMRNHMVAAKTCLIPIC